MKPISLAGCYAASCFYITAWKWNAAAFSSRAAFFFYTGNTGEGAIAALLPEAVHSGIAAGLRTLPHPFPL